MPEPKSHLWWLSFVDPAKAPPLEEQVPGGASFLGVCIVPGENLTQAVSTSWFLGCNPGGELLGIPIRPEVAIDPSWIGRLLSRDELEQLEREAQS
ncbi:hypothetical protein [Nocardia sp. CA-290969]|uniref:hypothetical protein n=1 Tax=Nocardia sp. CA-290969 TaxID=3239986 RepID=UPI003D8D0813